MYALSMYCFYVMKTSKLCDRSQSAQLQKMLVNFVLIFKSFLELLD